MGTIRRFTKQHRKPQMRSLSFDTTEEGKERWDICYGGLLVNPEGYDKKTRRVMRRTMEKFENIGKPTKDQAGLIRFEMGDEGAAIVLEEVEYELLLETIDKIRWTGLAVVKADKTVEWLEGTKAMTPEKVT